MNTTQKEALAELREVLVKENLYAVIVPANDSHFSEYIAPHWKCLRFITGFTGSAGTAIVTQNEAAIWVDSRYYIQAEAQSAANGFEIERVGLPETPTMAEWLGRVAPQDSRVGVDGKLYTIKQYQSSLNEFAQHNIEFLVTNDLFESVWHNRTPRPMGKARLLPDSVTGQSTLSKMNSVREKLSLGDDCCYIVTALDEIAWLLNMRGNDITFNPLVISYLVIGGSGAILFIDDNKIEEDDQEKLVSCGVEIRHYDSFGEYLSNLEFVRAIYNENRLDIHHYNLLQQSNAAATSERDNAGVATRLKATKNSVEVEGFREAMVLDGVALVKLHRWIEQQLADGVEISELEVSKKVVEVKSLCKEYITESFAQIVGSAASGALPHYSVPATGGRVVSNNNFLLMDLGSQYSCGTTDITRTVHYGEPTEQQKLDYTLVLQGMIDLTTTIFPVGATGENLDIVARRNLLCELRNYGHGTGHGVGHILNVHEGPFGIRTKGNPEEIREGSVLSNEPAIYRSGEYGIRTENMMLCHKVADNEFGSFLGFETLTLFPIDTRAIIVERMTSQQLSWLKSYHKEVYNKLSPHLSTEEQEWLAAKTDQSLLER